MALVPVTEGGFRDVRTGALCLLQYRTIASGGLIYETSFARSRPSLSHAFGFLFSSLRLAPYHVWPTVSPPSTSGYALCASFARKPTSHSCRAQLFRHLQSELLWSPRSSLKVTCMFLCGNMPTTNCLQAAWTAVFTTPMDPRADTKLCRHYRQSA